MPRKKPPPDPFFGFDLPEFDMPEIELDMDLLNLDLCQPAPIPPEMLRRLIQLCHPDKHQGSEAAHIATRYLLALKDKP